MAIADYARSIEIDSTSAFSYQFAGNKYFLENNLDRALVAFEEAIRLAPSSALGFNGRGLVRRARKQFDDAIVDFTEAIRLKPDYVGFWLNRAQAQLDKSDFAKAFADSNRALELDSRSYRALSLRGDVNYAVSQFDLAVADYTKAIDLAPVPVSTELTKRGRAYREKGDLALSIADYGRAIEENPGYERAYVERCVDRIKIGKDLDAAVGDCIMALSLRPRSATTLGVRGFARIKLKQFDLAFDDFTDALKAEAGNAYALLGRSLVHWQRGDKVAAEVDLNEAANRRSGIVRLANKYLGVTMPNEWMRLRAIERARKNPLVFAIAEGAADACGAKCKSWIVAQGDFDPGAAQRLRAFLDKPSRRGLPIVFNSTGGSMREAFAIGKLLRERRMTAIVAATIPDGCSEGVGACQKLFDPASSTKAAIRTKGAICHSACVYAVMGAVVRKIPEDVRVGVHHPVVNYAGRPEVEVDARGHATRLQYARQMGVDPELVAISDKTPFESLRLLTADEIARLRLATPGR